MLRLIFGLVASLFCILHLCAAQTSHSEVYLGSREGDPASIIENVSTIHGDYTEVEVDLTVAAPDTLVLSRFYSSRDISPVGSLGGWRFNPHCFLSVEKDPSRKDFASPAGQFEGILAYVGNPDGTIFTYEGWKNISDPTEKTLLEIDPEGRTIGLANTVKGEVTCWTNQKNNKLYYESESDTFELHLCSEGRRFYTKSQSAKHYIITHEILPSGNKIFYEFDDKDQLTLIKETNAAEQKVLAWIKIQHEDGVHIETSDGKTVDYQFQQDSSGNRLLTGVTRSNKPNLLYQYQVIGGRILLTKKILPEERFVFIEYYPEGASMHKVRSLTTPAGMEGESITHFRYKEKNTEVYGPKDRKTVYRYDDNLRLVAIEQYLDGSIYRIHRKSWGKNSDASFLISTSIADHEGKIFYHKYFIYDNLNMGNIVEEREYGDVTGAGAIPLEIDENERVTNQDGHIKYYSYFSGEESHGFFQRDAKGTGLKCWYKKGTNLLIRKFLLTNGSPDSEQEGTYSGIKQRYFYDYNEDTALIRVIVDDYQWSADSEKVSKTTERKITDICPKEDMPNVGAPCIVEQKYLSEDGKSECLFSKTINCFDSHGQISSQDIYDACGTHRYTLTKRYAHGQLIFETDPIGNEAHYSYDANRNLVTEHHTATGLTFSYVYDFRNRPTHVVEEDKAGTRYESRISYDEGGFKSCEIDRYGNKTTYINDVLGRPIRIIYPEVTDSYHSLSKPNFSFTYDLFDNPVTVTDPQGRILTNSYTVKGKPSEVNYLDGTSEKFRYDTGGNLRHYCRRDGILEEFEYDFLGRISRVNYGPKGNTFKRTPFKSTERKYSIFHKILERDARYNETQFTYDKQGRLKSLERGNRKTEFGYDAFGREESIKRWASGTEFSLEIKKYDLLNRVVEERIEDSVGRVLTRKKFVYSDAGNLIQIIGYPQNQESALLSYEYDNFGRLRRIINASGGITEVDYDDFCLTDWGQRCHKRSLIDPMGYRTEELYDAEDNLLQVSRKDRQGKLVSRSENAYDCLGNKVLERAQVIPKGQTLGNFDIEHSYNLKDQLDSIILGRGTAEERTTNFKYDSYGNLEAKYSPQSQDPITYKYDSYGNLVAVTCYEDGKKTASFKLTYDRNHNLRKVDQGFCSLSYTYNEHDDLLVETIKDKFGSYAVSRTYDGAGKIHTLQLPDGSYVKYSYEGPLVKRITRYSKNDTELYSQQVVSRDQMGNLLEEVLPGFTGGRAQSWDRGGRRTGLLTDFFQDSVTQYDFLDNIQKREKILDEGSFTSEYEYNPLLQLVSEKGHTEHRYDYDSIGNRLQRDDSEYKVNVLNELIEAEGASYTFHPNGNIATKTINESTWTYQSNPLEQIESITDPEQNIISFTYDLTGKRLSKHIKVRGKKTKTLRFFYLGDTEIGCLDERGSIIELKIPSNPNNSESPCVAFELKKETYIPIHDLQGNVACLVDQKRRKIVESYRYSAYGEEEILDNRGQIVSDSSVGNHWRYQAKRADTETGLIFFGYRYYDPEVGRWISPDPMGTIDGLNLYTFVRNNPLKYVDHFGFNSEIDENCGCTQHGHPGWHNAPPGCVCICGRDGANVGAPGSYRSKQGSDIKSALGGIGHGVLDFAIRSLHDLHTAAVYIGSAELEMSLNERIRMIEIVEQSQAKQLATVASHYMGIFGVEQPDAVYESCRSKTTLTLEIGSLVAAGYGAVKGVIAFNRLAKMPVQASRLIRTEVAISKNLGKSNNIWTATKKRTPAKNAFLHWKKHGADFPEFTNSQQYTQAAKSFIQNPPPDTLIKIRADGDILFYNPSTNSFVISSFDGVPRTMYKPSVDKHPYATNLEYFNAQ